MFQLIAFASSIFFITSLFTIHTLVSLFHVKDSKIPNVDYLVADPILICDINLYIKMSHQVMYIWWETKSTTVVLLANFVCIRLMLTLFFKLCHRVFVQQQWYVLLVIFAIDQQFSTLFLSRSIMYSEFVHCMLY